MNQITGTIIAAGPGLTINGEQRCCFVVECSGQDIMNIARNKLFNKRVFVQADRRVSPRPAGAPAIVRLNNPPHQPGFVHLQPKRRFKCSDLIKS
jgi:hypothetical protein